MPKGCCSDDTCSCLITAGEGINVAGSGTQSNPYIITADTPDFSGSMQVRDSQTVNLSIFGSGIPSDPFVLQAESTMSLVALSDVDDPEGGPTVGDVPVWIGTGDAGHFEFRPPPTAPAGAVNATRGIVGLGTLADPLEVNTSGVWGQGDLAGLGTDTTVGLETYIDVNGQLRAQPVNATAPNWNSITGKPGTYVPAPHTHSAAQITNQDQLDAGRVGGHRIFVQNTTPVGATQGDLWFRWA